MCQLTGLALRDVPREGGEGRQAGRPAGHNRNVSVQRRIILARRRTWACGRASLWLRAANCTHTNPNAGQRSGSGSVVSGQWSGSGLELGPGVEATVASSYCDALMEKEIAWLADQYGAPSSA